jgi:hypothetical protein
LERKFDETIDFQISGRGWPRFGTGWHKSFPECSVTVTNAGLSKSTKFPSARIGAENKK